jgi:hypothetical protein
MWLQPFKETLGSHRGRQGPGQFPIGNLGGELSGRWKQKQGCGGV